MAKRKTIKVERLKELVNLYLLNSRDDNAGLRYGNAALLEQVLHETGNYRGYGYLNAENMKSSEFGFSMGVNTSVVGARKYLFMGHCFCRPLD